MIIVRTCWISLGPDCKDPMKENRIVRRNLRPEFLTALSLSNISTMRELRDSCKLLEADFVRASNYGLSRLLVEPEKNLT